jgi:hypothetical protein
LHQQVLQERLASRWHQHSLARQVLQLQTHLR